MSVATETTLEHAPPGGSPSPGRLVFGGGKEFQVELRRRVDAFIAQHGRAKRDSVAMYVKTAVLVGTLLGSYTLLVFFATAWWQAVPLAVILAFAAAGIGFNVMHDGGHRAYSRHAWVNKIMAMSLELLGGSSYIWNYKHVVFHHTYCNIEGHDTDIEIGPIARLSPHQPRYWFHRYQHYYLWVLYGFMAVRWQIFGDWRDVVTGTIGNHKIPRPTGWNLAIFIGGKLTFLTLAFGVPLMIHPWWVVAMGYGLVACVLGILLSVVFQLAHCVEEAEFPLPAADTGRIETAWAIHQVETTVDFARRSKIVAWYLGGLNFQIEHHLFPKLCHVNYPAIAPIVEATCREFGIQYQVHETVWDGIVSHYKWLRRMGQPKTA